MFRERAARASCSTPAANRCASRSKPCRTFSNPTSTNSKRLLGRNARNARSRRRRRAQLHRARDRAGRRFDGRGRRVLRHRARSRHRAPARRGGPQHRRRGRRHGRRHRRRAIARTPARRLRAARHRLLRPRPRSRRSGITSHAAIEASMQEVTIQLSPNPQTSTTNPPHENHRSSSPRHRHSSQPPRCSPLAASRPGRRSPRSRNALACNPTWLEENTPPATGAAGATHSPMRGITFDSYLRHEPGGVRERRQKATAAATSITSTSASPSTSKSSSAGGAVTSRSAASTAPAAASRRLTSAASTTCSRSIGGQNVFSTTSYARAEVFGRQSRGQRSAASAPRTTSTPRRSTAST